MSVANDIHRQFGLYHFQNIADIARQQFVHTLAAVQKVLKHGVDIEVDIHRDLERRFLRLQQFDERNKFSVQRIEQMHVHRLKHFLNEVLQFVRTFFIADGKLYRRLQTYGVHRRDLRVRTRILRRPIFHVLKSDINAGNAQLNEQGRFRRSVVRRLFFVISDNAHVRVAYGDDESEPERFGIFVDAGSVRNGDGFEIQFDKSVLKHVERTESEQADDGVERAPRYARVYAVLVRRARRVKVDFGVQSDCRRPRFADFVPGVRRKQGRTEHEIRRVRQFHFGNMQFFQIDIQIAVEVGDDRPLFLLLFFGDLSRQTVPCAHDDLDDRTVDDMLQIFVVRTVAQADVRVQVDRRVHFVYVRYREQDTSDDPGESFVDGVQDIADGFDVDVSARNGTLRRSEIEFEGGGKHDMRQFFLHFGVQFLARGLVHRHIELSFELRVAGRVQNELVLVERQVDRMDTEIHFDTLSRRSRVVLAERVDLDRQSDQIAVAVVIPVFSSDKRFVYRENIQSERYVRRFG